MNRLAPSLHAFSKFGYAEFLRLPLRPGNEVKSNDLQCFVISFVAGIAAASAGIIDSRPFTTISRATTLLDPNRRYPGAALPQPRRRTSNVHVEREKRLPHILFGVRCSVRAGLA
jgi:hypothetical protein